MANKVSIGVDAQLDTAGVNQGIDKITQKINQANKQKFSPIDKSTLAQLDAVNRKFQELLKVNRELNRRVNATGQSGSMFENINFDAIFPDNKVRGRKVSQIRRHIGLGAGSPGPGVEPHPGRPGGGFGAMAGQVAQSGMRAAGPVGGVAASAVGTGMSAGFGAGLMGLMGGMLALGVGKLVSGVMDKVDQAENNSVAMDKLKRTLGDVNVSFEGLKAVVNGGAENLKITYAEAGKLATQFAKLGNMRADQYTSLHDELGVGVGLARSFGLDPEQGVGVMGEMRGIGVTKDTQDSKRFALLIGETIAKSDAFAKADEVIGAIGSFAVSQTRNNMGAANVQGYAGAFAGLVGSGIAGLDPSGAGSLLGRINASLSAGGAKGEASQYFTGMIGSSMGLNPYETRMLREGGAFASQETMFGADSAYANYKGKARPGGGATFMQATLDRLRKQYGAGSDELADATANHLGIGINQAMALLSVKPEQMGEISSYAGDLTKLNGSGIGNLSKIFGKDPSDRKGVADGLLARGDVSSSDKDAIRDAMTKGEDVQKQTLARITAQYDQEQTTGKDVRDSKNALDNIKTSIADKLVPYFNEARLGIMSIAGVGGKTSSDDIMRKVLEANSNGRRAVIEGQFAPETKQLYAKHKSAMDSLKINNDVSIYEAAKAGNPELAEKMKKAQEQAIKDMKDVASRLDAINEEKLELLKQENAAHTREVEELNKQAAKRMLLEIGSVENPNESSAETARLARSGVSNAAMAPDTYDDLFVKYGKQYGVDPKLLKAIAMKESGMRPGAVSGANSNGTRDYGLMQHNSAYIGSRGLTNDWDKPESSIEAAAKLLRDNISRGGSVRAGVRMYNGSGPKAEAYADDVMGRYGNTKIKGADGTPLPEGSVSAAPTAAGGDGKIQVEVLIAEKGTGREISRQVTNTRVQNNWRPSMGY